LKILLLKVAERLPQFTLTLWTRKANTLIPWYGRGVYENWYEAITSTLEEYQYGQFNPDTLSLVPQDIIVNDYGQLRNYEIVFDYEDYFEYLPDDEEYDEYD
jgi:hypothetical protein